MSEDMDHPRSQFEPPENMDLVSGDYLPPPPVFYNPYEHQSTEFVASDNDLPPAPFQQLPPAEFQEPPAVVDPRYGVMPPSHNGQDPRWQQQMQPYSPHGHPGYGSHGPQGYPSYGPHGPHGHPNHGPHGHPNHGPHGHPNHGPQGHQGCGPHCPHAHHGHPNFHGSPPPEERPNGAQSQKKEGEEKSSQVMGLALLGVAAGGLLGYHYGGLYGGMAGGVLAGGLVNAYRAYHFYVQGTEEGDKEAKISGTYAVGSTVLGAILWDKLVSEKQKDSGSGKFRSNDYRSNSWGDQGDRQGKAMVLRRNDDRNDLDYDYEDNSEEIDEGEER